MVSSARQLARLHDLVRETEQSSGRTRTMAWKGKDNKTALSLSRQTRKTLVAGGSIMGGVVLVANMGQRGPLRASAENGFRTLIYRLYGNTKSAA